MKKLLGIVFLFTFVFQSAYAQDTGAVLKDNLRLNVTNTNDIKNAEKKLQNLNYLQKTTPRKEQSAIVPRKSYSGQQ